MSEIITESSNVSIDLSAPITMFVGEWAWLSNFWKVDVTYRGQVYRSAEHAFQAAKCAEVREHDAIKAMTLAVSARTAGHNCKRWADWEDVKESVMVEVVSAKFEQNPDLREKLMATGDRELVEGTMFRDDFWGKVPARMSGGQVREWRGENVLGEILMAVRDRLRNEGARP